MSKPVEVHMTMSAGADKKNILVTTDFSDTSLKSFTVAKNLAHALNARVHLLALVEDPAVASAAMMVDTPYAVPIMGGPSLEEVVEKAAEKLSALVDKHFSSETDIECHVRELTDSTDHDILKFCHEYHVDYIVMATHGRTGASRFFLGSVCDRVIRSAPCPVVAVPGVEHH